MRRTVYLGASVQVPVNVRGPQRRSWPDIDIKLVQQQTALEELHGARAIALGYETDWDLVRVYFSGAGDEAAELLGPGRIISTVDATGAPRAISRIEPVTAAPATRLYDAAAMGTGLLAPQRSALTDALIPGVGTGDWTFADTPATHDGVYVWAWGADGWGNQGFSPDQDPPLLVFPGNLLPWHTPYGSIETGGGKRPHDYSFDRVFSIGDLMLAGIVSDATTTPVYRSKYATDMHGQPGDPAEPPTLTLSPLAGGGIRYADLWPLFYARLAVDVWDTCPAENYEPRLAPARYISFGPIVVPGGGGGPTIPLVTFPLVNARGVEFLFRNTGGGDVYAVILSPAATDAVDSTLGVPNVEDPPPAPQYVTIPAGAEGSLVLDRPRHPFGKIALGSNTGATITDAVLTIKREFDQ